MDKISCHSSTSQQELIDFANLHKGKTISILYELNGFVTWGNDDYMLFDTSIDLKFKELLKLIKNNYIHHIEVKN